VTAAPTLRAAILGTQQDGTLSYTGRRSAQGSRLRVASHGHAGAGTSNRRPVRAQQVTKELREQFVLAE